MAFPFILITIACEPSLRYPELLACNTLGHHRARILEYHFFLNATEDYGVCLRN